MVTFEVAVNATNIKLIQPDWDAPSHVMAYSTCRQGGFSTGVYASLNVGDHVGDRNQDVAANRALLPNADGIVWLQQVHGSHCLVLASDTVLATKKVLADASISSNSLQACAVMTADCLPVLLCDDKGSIVAAVHAGWRGLADGIIEQTVATMAVQPHTLMAWLGPAIGQQNFEVGVEVYQAFSQYQNAFEHSVNYRSESPKYQCDLYKIAKQKLHALGIMRVSGGQYCTYAQENLFFSHRRASHQGHATTGRMVSVIYLNKT
ncbi:MAG: peptidoglycan editing factor PgeF [Paraglaciecola sp.]|nr:peptidoglycan editing factor PgeF [Paraglaciecola sp.]NCT48182.1 peptidoglycan editing factor PgeF [Paraglaciecola sp.]